MASEGNKVWYCLVINSSTHHGNSDKVVSEITSVLKAATSEIFVINDKELMKTGEYFIFAEGKNVLKKKDELVKLAGVIRIISVGEQPYAFTEKEVSSFTRSIEKKDKITTFKKGDVVFIKEGSLKNLFGLVCGIQKTRVKILMRFSVRNFFVYLEPKVLKREKSIFENQPPNIDKKEWFEKFVN